MDNRGLSDVPLILFFILLFLFSLASVLPFVPISNPGLKISGFTYLAPLFPAFLRMTSSAYLMPLPL